MNIHASRGRACGRSASPWASSCCWSGSSMALVDRRARRRHRRRLRVPLGPRPRAASAVSTSPRGRAGGARPATAPAAGADAPSPRHDEAELHAREVPRGDDARPRRRDRRRSSRCRCSASRCCPAFLNQGGKDHDLGPLDDYPEGEWMIATFPTDPDGRRRLAASPSSSATTASLGDEEASRASRSSPTTACTSAARCSRTGRRPELTEKKVRRRDAARRRSRRASAARATAASTTPRATAPPARPCARSTATQFSVAHRRLFLGRPFSVSEVEGTGGDGADLQVEPRVPRRARRRSPVLALPDPAPELMARPTPDHRPRADPLPGRLARGAVGPRRRDPLLPLPERPGRRQLVPDARLGDADRLHRPGGDRRDPGDVLQARPRRRRTRRSSTSRTISGPAGSSAACTAGAPPASSS